MSYQVKKDSRILSDIEEALSYYDAISPELGESLKQRWFRHWTKLKTILSTTLAMIKS
jgi:hypothetical protein